jgi:hypothetical protein
MNINQLLNLLNNVKQNTSGDSKVIFYCGMESYQLSEKNGALFLDNDLVAGGKLQLLLEEEN